MNKPFSRFKAKMYEFQFGCYTIARMLIYCVPNVEVMKFKFILIPGLWVLLLESNALKAAH